MPSYSGPYAVIVPTGVLQNSSDVFAILDPDAGGAATFSVPLSADGLDPPTYYGAYTLLEDATYVALTQMTTQEFKTYLDTLADQRGRAQLSSATAFKNSVQISGAGEDFWSYIAGLGLQRINPPV
jgi:hypothetical protein